MKKTVGGKPSWSLTSAKWNAVLVEIKPSRGKATLTLNNNRAAHFPLKAGAIDQVQFRINGYGTVLLDSLTIVHAVER